LAEIQFHSFNSNLEKDSRIFMPDPDPDLGMGFTKGFCSSAAEDSCVKHVVNGSICKVVNVVF